MAELSEHTRKLVTRKSFQLPRGKRLKTLSYLYQYQGEWVHGYRIRQNLSFGFSSQPWPFLEYLDAEGLLLRRGVIIQGKHKQECKLNAYGLEFAIYVFNQQLLDIPPVFSEASVLDGDEASYDDLKREFPAKKVN